MSGGFFSRQMPNRMARDAGPLSPAELMALRRLLREGGAAPARKGRSGAGVREESLSTREVALRLGFRSTRTVCEMVKRGEFPGAFAPGYNRVRIPVADVAAFESRRGFGPREIDRALNVEVEG